MPLFALPSCHCFEAADSIIRFIGRRFNSTRGRDRPSVLSAGVPLSRAKSEYA